MKHYMLEAKNVVVGSQVWYRGLCYTLYKINDSSNYCLVPQYSYTTFVVSPHTEVEIQFDSPIKNLHDTTEIKK